MRLVQSRKVLRDCFLKTFLDTDFTELHGKTIKKEALLRVFRALRVQKEDDTDLRNTLLTRMPQVSELREFYWVRSYVVAPISLKLRDDGGSTTAHQLRKS